MEILFPIEANWEQLKHSKADIPFAPQVVAFLNALSTSLLKDPDSKAYPDVITFAFFCRKANMLKISQLFNSEAVRLGRGIVFHVAPSNVPINFGYSLVAGLLSGNYNIVRISSKIFPQVDLIIKHLHTLYKSNLYSDITQRVLIVRYDRLSNGTTFLSALCNVRVIWGGDDTIAQIRKSPIPPRSFDVTFADRYSIAVLNADELILESDMQRVAENFYNDTYLFDQNACSAPHLIFWYGKNQNITTAKEMFWAVVHTVVKKKYNLQTVLAVDKLTAFYKQSIGMSITKVTTSDNLLIRAELKTLSDKIDEYRCAGGYFSEYSIKSLDEISSIVTNKYQTLAYYGFKRDDLQKFVVGNRIVGIDRIVPIGSTTDFNLIWDGYDLISTLSRICSII